MKKTKQILYKAALFGWILLTTGTCWAGMNLVIAQNPHENAPSDYSVMVRVSQPSPFLFGTLALPGGGTELMGAENGELVFMQSFPDFTSLIASGWTSGTYEITAYDSPTPTYYSVTVPSFSEGSFPYPASLNLEEKANISITPEFEIDGDWFWFGITNATGTEVFSAENTNYNWRVLVDAGHALEYETPYTAMALTVWPWANPYLGSLASLPFTTGFEDQDTDGLPDTWEQQIVDNSLVDTITVIGDVLARDDYDNDGFSNQEEYVGGLDPVVMNSGIYTSVEEGLTLLSDSLSPTEFHAGKIALADHCFAAAVAANSGDYEARLYRAISRLLNLLNNTELHSMIGQFGISINAFLEPSGDVDMDNALLVDEIMNIGPAELISAIDASLADLAVIPSNWTGTIQISTNDFPMNETVYLDLADISFSKSALSLLGALARTAKAQSLNVDYDALQQPMSGPVTTITIDGNTNDWASIPAQLYGEQFSPISTVRAARSASSLYLLIEARKTVFDQDWWLNGDLLIGQDQFAWFELNNTYSEAGYDNSGINIFGLNKAISGTIIELEIPIPSGVTVSNICVEELSISMGQNYIWQSAYLCSPDNTPAEVLLQNHPSFLESIRSVSALQAARTNLSDAITHFFTADTLADNRTDALMHFVEYDPTNAVERAEIVARIQEVQASLDAPVLFTVTNALGEVEFEDRIHLGAFFEPNYLTRGMLPEFHRVLSQPLAGTFPDPTFGGILPDLVQTNINAWFEDAMDDVDYDYLPNSWESTYFNTVTGASANGDEDDDDFNNLEEYIGGSNPTNATSVFVVNGDAYSDLSGSGFEVQWDALPGRTYSIWRSTSLASGFELLISGVSEGSYQDSNPAASNAFYRVEAELN